MNRRALSLAGAAITAASVAAFAAPAVAKTVTYEQPGLGKGPSPITQVNVCKHTGLKGPNGEILIYAFAIKGQSPSSAAESCSHGKAAVKAGIKYVDRDTEAQDIIPGAEKKPPKATYGETVTADHAKYTIDKFIWGGATLPCFVSGGVVFAIAY